MGRSPCCSKEGMNKGAWTTMEDKILTDYINLHGEGKWRKISNEAGLKRCGKSCRLRWMNYLRPDIKRGNISPDEEDLIIRLHKLLGNRWSLIAGRLPGRTDNEIKNYWNTHLSKKEQRKPKANHSKVEKKPIVISSNVIRTKASRCKEVFIYPQHIVAAESEKSDGSITTMPSCKEEKNLGFMVGTDADDQNSVSEIFAHDFANDLGCTFEMGNLTQGDDDAAENYLSKVAEQLQQKWSTGKNYIQDDLDSDFGSLVAFLESAEEWLI